MKSRSLLFASPLALLLALASTANAQTIVIGSGIKTVLANGSALSPPFESLNCGSGTTCAKDSTNPGQVNITASGGGGSGYATIQEEGSSLTQRVTLNFIGSALTCVDNAGNTRTNCTLTQTPTTSASVVGSGRTITCGNALTGCGDLSADRTLAVTTSPASQTPVGTTRQVASGTGLSGGGDLSADRTLSVAASQTTISSIVAPASTALTITGNAASSWTTSAGALTLTAAAASTWSTAAGALTITGNAGLTLNTAGAANVTVDTGSSSNNVTLGTTTAGAVQIGRAAQGTTVNGNFTASQNTVFGGWQAPSSIGGAVNDWSPTNLNVSAYIIVASTSNVTLSGISASGAGAVTGRRICLLNGDATNTITLTNQDTNSTTAADRIITPSAANFVINPGAVYCLIYRASSTNRWYLEGGG